MLPDMDGFEVCRRIRAGNARIGIIMLTARTQEMDKVTGLMTGADDYVTKPFSPAELTARIDALYRRTGGDDIQDSGEVRQPPFLLNTRNRTLEKNGERIRLTQVEYSIIKMFMDNPGKALSREEILDAVWGHDYFGELKIVDVNIRRLRLKIEDDPTNPTFITTVWATATSGGSETLFMNGPAAAQTQRGGEARCPSRHRPRPWACASADAQQPERRDPAGRSGRRGLFRRAFHLLLFQHERKPQGQGPRCGQFH